MEISNEDLLQIQMNIIGDCIAICDKNRGYLDVPEKIMKHFGIVATKKPAATKKATLLRIVK